MSVVNVKELGRSASAVVAGVVDTRRPAVITRSGHPVAVLVPLDAASTTEALEDWALAHLPEFARSRAASGKEIATGKSMEAGAFFRSLERPRAVKKAVKKRSR